MRLIKTLGLAAVATMAAMAFVGATSASATSTQLCNAHDGLTCDAGEAASNFIMSNEGTGRLLSSLVDILCDEIDGEGTPLALANPQSVHVSGLDFTSCETSAGDGCVVTVLQQPLSNLLKTGLDAGTITGTNGSTLVDCEDVFFGTDLHCIYDATGLSFAVGAQHLTANNTQVDFVSGGSLCPDESFLDGLLRTGKDTDPDKDDDIDPDAKDDADAGDPPGPDRDVDNDHVAQLRYILA